MKIILTFFLTGAFTLLAAQETQLGVADARLEEAISLEFDGLVLDQTRTRIGREFYELFYAKWAGTAIPSGSDILLEEQPVRGLFGFLEIKVNDTVVAAYRLQPGAEWMETAVQEATQRVGQYLQQLEQIQQDLENQDQAGSGIY